MEEADIRPGKLFQRYLELCAADAKTYFVSPRRIDLPCPACGNHTYQRVFEKVGFGYTVCLSCQTLYQNPRPLIEEFAFFYRDSSSASYWAKEFFPTVAEIRREKLFKPKVLELARLCKNENFKPVVVADVGAGYGLFLEEWRNLFPETLTIAIEPNPDLAEVCRSKKLQVIESFLEETGPLHNKTDMVVAMELIEHVHDPYKFCLSLRRLLRDGGKVLLTGLTVDGFDIQTLWEHSKSVSPPHHINFLSVLGFEKLLARTGFSNIRIFTPGKLDVDIVKNFMTENPNILLNQRFLRNLFRRNGKALMDFQVFLSDHQLSSHCWIWAEK